MDIKVVLPLVHLDNLVFTPLPQFALKAYAVENEVCHEEEIEIIEFSREDDIANSLMSILETKPQIVGFSCYVWNFLVVEKISNAIKEMLGEKCLIVWGGPHISEKPYLFAQKFPLSVDLVVGWYGEKSFSEIIDLYKKNYSNGEIAEQINGVWSIETPDKKLDFDFVPLNEIPNPHVYDWFPQTLKDQISERVFLVETYRNCPFQCGYCLWGQAENKINGLSAETFKTTFDSLIEMGARHFKFADAGLGLMKKRDKEIFRYFIEKKVDKDDIVINLSCIPSFLKHKCKTLLIQSNRFVIDSHSLNNYSLKTKIIILLEKLLFFLNKNNVDFIITQSETMHAILRQIGYPRDKLITIAYKSKNETDYINNLIRKAGNVFLYVSSDEPHKNHRNLIEGWCLLSDEKLFPKLVLTIDDNTDLYKHIMNKSKEHCLNIEIKSNLSRDEIINLYKYSTALIYPSFFESYGLPLVEAVQYNLPVIASELDYVRDILDPEFTFNPNSPKSISRSVKRFLNVTDKKTEIVTAKEFLLRIIKL